MNYKTFGSKDFYDAEKKIDGILAEKGASVDSDVKALLKDGE